jgi:hypothetical protein
MAHKMDNPQIGSNQTGIEQPISPPDLNGFHADGLSDPSPTQEAFSPNNIDPTPSDSKSSLIDDLFDVLSNRRRRHVVYFLKRTTQPVEIGTLATQIAAWETDQPMAEVTRAERKRVYTSLQQVHLPKMDNVGLIRFEKPSSLIEPTPLLADVDLDSSSPDGSEQPWHQYYALLSLASIGVVGTAVANIWPTQLVPTIAWFGTVVSLFFILACIHTYNTEADLNTLVSINRSLFSAHE